jgi:hypothetical protein
MWYFFENATWILILIVSNFLMIVYFNRVIKKYDSSLEDPKDKLFPLGSVALFSVAIPLNYIRGMLDLEGASDFSIYYLICFSLISFFSNTFMFVKFHVHYRKKKNSN